MMSNAALAPSCWPAVSQGQVEEDPVAILKADHAAAAQPKVCFLLCVYCSCLIPTLTYCVKLALVLWSVVFAPIPFHRYKDPSCRGYNYETPRWKNI